MHLHLFSQPPIAAAVMGLAFSLSGSAPAQTAPADATAAQTGLQIYRDGRLPDGTPLRAERPSLGAVVGAAAACESCHRRSGLGAQEGRILVPPIAGPILFQPGQTHLPQRPGRAASIQVEPPPHQARPAYDRALLARALREGIDANGRPFGALMPRYTLNDQQVAQLETYLQTLTTAMPAGVSAGQIHLATVITPDAPPERSATVIKTLSAWAARGTLRGLRPQLHVWQLSGPPASWPEQLQQWQHEQPVYAVLSGAGSADWAPVQAFCERERLPCLLPLLDRIPASQGNPPSGHYSLYFSAGVDAEVRMAARHLQTKIMAPARIVQVQQIDVPLSLDAAQLFASAWAGLEPTGVAASPGASIETLDAWSAHFESDRMPISAALWLRPAALQALVNRFPDGLPGVAQVLLSAQLSPPDQLQLPPAWERQVLWASMHADPLRLRAAKAMVLHNWLKRMELPEEPGTAQAETYAAIFFLGDAMARMRLGWSQDYLLEQLEYAVNNRPAGAVYFSLSLGPSQRVAAKSGRMLSLTHHGSASGVDRLQPVSGLISVED